MLKEVSRSFYLSLRLLPRPMRGAASLGYLLARASDTIADSAVAPVEVRLECLESFGRAVAGERVVPRWPAVLLNAVPDAGERRLLEATGELVAWLGRLPRGEAVLVREVLGTIVGGQALDLERFGRASREEPVGLLDEGELEDYTWRVAGCVGAFWTRLGLLTMGAKFSKAPEAELMEHGIAYGKGLQLVNILRDVPADLAEGRCYLPVENPGEVGEIMECHAHWVENASEWVGHGRIYAELLESRRLRVASGLPARIGEMTLNALRGASWETLGKRVKVGRGAVYGAMARALLSR